MPPSTRYHYLTACAAALILASCSGGLPKSLRRTIAGEKDDVRYARQQLQKIESHVRQEVASAPDLFRDVSAPSDWENSLRGAESKLDRAERDASELSELARKNRSDSRNRAEQLLTEERSFRESALKQSHAVEASAAKWLDFQHDLPAHLNKMKREYEAIRAVDLESVSGDVEKAEHDWPAKKALLEERLASLRAIPKDADAQWQSTEPARTDASAGKIGGSDMAILIQEDDRLGEEAHTLRLKTDELDASCEQLYDAWDKILTDLDASRYGESELFRERIKTVRTHFADSSLKQSHTSSDERWTTVSEAAYHSAENDIGMAIAHKDAGLFDSEAQMTPQPAGFAYIAPESQGSNQYGYWTHRDGQSFWTFLPEYLILRELLWNHDYRPVVLDEYRAYRTTAGTGRTYYGQETPNAPPKYGTRGTFTQTHYAQSRYVQSGGFKGSAYASSRNSSSPSTFNASRPDEHGSASSNSSAGRRFGSGNGVASGKRFGAGGMRSPGRSFGRHR